MSALRKPSPLAVRLNPRTHAKLLAFAKDEDRPMEEIVAELVDRYEREQFWISVRAAYARLKADPVAWQDYVAEVEAWDALSGDGLRDEAPYYTPEEERAILAEVAARRTQGR